MTQIHTHTHTRTDMYVLYVYIQSRFITASYLQKQYMIQFLLNEYLILKLYEAELFWKSNALIVIWSRNRCKTRASSEVC